MQKKITIAPNIYMVEDFFTQEECKKHIEFAEENGFIKATIQTSRGLVVNESIRNNSRFSYDNYDFSQKLFEKMKEYLPDTSFDSVGTDNGYISFTIEPKVGTALFFYHKTIHIGEEVTKGAKYAMRSDVMYCSGLGN